MRIYRGIYHGQVIAKKNSKVISINRSTGKPFVRSNDTAKNQELNMAYDFENQFVDEGFTEPFNSAVEVIVEIWNQDNRPRDLDNQISTILDALVKGHVLFDDNQKYVSQIKGYVRGVDPKNPRAVVTIYEMTD